MDLQPAAPTRGQGLRNLFGTGRQGIDLNLEPALQQAFNLGLNESLGGEAGYEEGDGGRHDFNQHRLGVVRNEESGAATNGARRALLSEPLIDGVVFYARSALS